MGIVKKNKLHNPQIITDAPPATVTEADIGRLWVDTANNSISIALGNTDTGAPELRNLLDSNDLALIDDGFYRGMSEEVATIVLQTQGDTHFDNGYDFFSDSTYLKNATQAYDDFYAYYYREVPNTNSLGYVRTISTDDGVRHIRNANGSDTYDFNSVTTNHVNYTKINLSKTIKGVLEIKFDNKDVIDHGFTLLPDKQTILLYCDPEGFFKGKTVKIKYLI